MNESMIQFSYDGFCLRFDKENLRYSILAGKTAWETEEEFLPGFCLIESSRIREREGRNAVLCL